MPSFTPKFRLGNAVVSLRRANSVREIREPALARRIVTAAREQLAPREFDDLVVAHVLRQDPRAEDELQARILDGTYVVVIEDEVRRLVDAPKSVLLSSLIQTHDSEPARPKRPPEVPAIETFFALRLTTQTGGSFAGADLQVRLPDGSTHQIVLDERSSWRADPLTLEGRASIVVIGTLEPNAEAAPLDDIDLTAAPVVAAGAPIPDLPTGVENTIVVDVPGPRCVRLVGAMFALNKAFVLPEAMEGIRLLGHMYARLPDAALLIVGHTDTTGTAWRNDSLSLQRADSMLQFLTDDVDGWYAYYGKQTDASRRWGMQEDLAMLAALPRGAQPYYDEDHVEHSLEGATKRFQIAQGLAVTGELDEATRRALIAEYMAIDGTSLPGGVTAVPHGCGQHFLAVQTEDDVEALANRRVEVFLFPEGIDPPPPARLSEPGSAEYPAWLESIVEQRTFRPSAYGLGTLEVVTDIEESHQDASGVTFMLRSTDGAFECEMHPAEGKVIGGYTVLEFTEMPVASFYSLVVRYASGHESTLFDDVPYRELSGVGAPPAGKLLDPITLQPVAPAST